MTIALLGVGRGLHVKLLLSPISPTSSLYLLPFSTPLTPQTTWEEILTLLLVCS